MHKPVLLKEILGILKGHFKDTSNLHIVDATFGQGGYTKQFVKSFKRVSALDRDPMAFAAASKLSEKYPNLHPIHSKFSNISSIFEPESIDAIVFDLGLCSAQISDNSRGFSFMNDGPLDMRMDPSTNTETIGNVRRDKTITAGTIINTFSEHEIADILLKYGEETRSKSIAFEICKQRIKTPFETSIQLANCIEKSVGWYKKGFHPATKSFQALRIYVNDEIQELEIALKDSIKILKVNGMMLFVTFHSLEDRPVKRACSVINVDKKYKKFILPSEEEITDNVRSRSAKLRVAVKTSAVIEEVVVEEEAENLTLRDLRRQGRIRKNKMIQEGERLDRLELELDDDRMI